MTLTKEPLTLPSPKLWQALLPVVLLVSLLAANIWVFGDDALSGSMQSVLLLISGLTALWATCLGVKWMVLQKGLAQSISQVLDAIVILLLIGALAGTWMLSGVIPTLIHYGLFILHPRIFLFAACVISALISLATGSSWSTLATFGVALLGIGKILGFHEGWIAGAVISGAYFGDKMSPLSDTTVLAPSVAKTDIFSHIRYMIYTTVPSISLALLMYLGKGLFFSPTGGTSVQTIGAVQEALLGTFRISPLLLLVPALVLWMIWRKAAPIPTLFVGTVLGGVVALLVQQPLLQRMGGDAGSWHQTYVTLMKAFYTETSYDTGHATLDSLLPTKGMEGMLWTIWLVLCAMVFGGIMQAAGFLDRLTRALVSLARSVLGLVSSTLGTCMFLNVAVGDQYLAIVLPGKMFQSSFEKKGLPPQLLSRSLEDAGTVTSVLVPWNTCGATQSAVLGVSTLTYLPYCFFNLLSPLVSFLIVAVGWKVYPFAYQKDRDIVTHGAE